jgi:alkylation response protein AidB-like acyl-CoA dehydrogenase
MNFGFTPEQNAWRDELRAFFRAELPPGYDGGDSPILHDEDFAFARAFHQKLAAKGWLVMAWPGEYGGGGAGILEQLIFHEEYGYHRAPYLGPGVSFVGPALIHHGSDEQKRRHLPEIAAATVYWCQGFSEPGAGSDLAALQTTAAEDGDSFTVNGSKIWTTMAHHADWCWLAVRTDGEGPKHRGISVLLVDMTSPGITIRPIRNLKGEHSFNQVFFDGVRVPRGNLVGPKNRGWYVVATSLDYERSVITSSAAARRTLEELLQYARETTGPDGRSLAKDPVLAGKLAQLAIEIEVSLLLAYQNASVQLHGRVPNREASILKLYANELLQRLSAVVMELLGPAAVLRGPRAPLGGRMAMRSLHSISSTIAGGSSEVQRNIIATRGLGMPR